MENSILELIAHAICIMMTIFTGCVFCLASSRERGLLNTTPLVAIGLMCFAAALMSAVAIL